MTSNIDNKIALSVDIGGTFIKFAIINRQGIMLDFWKRPTNLEDTGKHIPFEITKDLKAKLSEEKFKNLEVVGMGIGIPGFPTLDGKVKFSGNIGWRDYDIKKDLREWWGDDIQMFVHNDCHMAALGEKFIGVAKETKNYVFLALGTGLGSGIVINKELYQGAGGSAGEFGHVPMQPWDKAEFQCTCGLPECIEPVFSATGFVHLYKKQKQLHPELDKGVEEDGAAIWKAVNEGDELAINAAKEFAEYGGRLLASIAMTLNPEKIILGGGLAHDNNTLIEYLKPVYEKFTHDFIRESTSFQLCHVGNDSALYGAAYTVFKNTDNLIK